MVLFLGRVTPYLNEVGGKSVAGFFGLELIFEANITHREAKARAIKVSSILHILRTLDGGRSLIFTVTTSAA
jgi:hypothetical protein